MTPHRWSMRREGPGIDGHAPGWSWTCHMCGAFVWRQRRLVGKTTPPDGSVLKAGFLDCAKERLSAVKDAMES